MRKFALSFLLLLTLRLNGQIIADHTVVDKYTDIPQQYIDSVKKMWIQVLGESHSGGYRTGLDLLSSEIPKFKATSQTIGEPGRLMAPNPCDASKYGLRVSLSYWDPTQFELGENGGWYFRHYDYTNFPYDRYVGVGEEDFWTTQWAVDNMKANVAACNDPKKGNTPLSAIGFAWCWTDLNGTGSQLDTEFGVHWGGYTTYYWNGNGFSMATSWGLNAADSVLTNNNISLDNYINAIVEIGKVDPKTLCFFTTGPVDPLNDAQSQENSESEYQKNIKYDYIRNYVKNNGGFLFDYADILSYNNAGIQQTASWNGHTYQIIHPDNNGEYNNTHIGDEGCKRIAKAMWWMLARYAGWDGDSIPKYKTTKNVSICQGESYFAGNANQTASGTYYDTLEAKDGLDSIILTHLTINTIYNEERYANLCEGESFLLGDSAFSKTGTYTMKFSSQNRCDSSITLHLTIYDLPEVDLGPDRILNEDEMLELDAGAGYAYYTWNTGEITQKITADHQLGIGTHQISVEVNDANKCSNSDTIMITIDKVQQVGLFDKLLKSKELYPNPSSGIINIDIGDDLIPIQVELISEDGIVMYSKLFNSSNHTKKLDIRHMPDGVYLLKLVSSYSTHIYKVILKR
jgi:hypothetical protein